MSKLSFKHIWSMIMTLVFLGMFVLLVFTDFFANMSFPVRLILGAVFLVYSFFRGYQIWNDLK